MSGPTSAAAPATTPPTPTRHVSTPEAMARPRTDGSAPLTRASATTQATSRTAAPTNSSTAQPTQRRDDGFGRRRTTRDRHVHGHEVPHRPLHAVRAGEHAAVASAVAQGDDPLGRGHGLVGLDQGVHHVARHRSRHQQHVGMARRGHQPHAVPLQVIDRSERRGDLDLAPVARARIHVPHLHRAAETQIARRGSRVVTVDNFGGGVAQALRHGPSGGPFGAGRSPPGSAHLITPRGARVAAQRGQQVRLLRQHAGQDRPGHRHQVCDLGADQRVVHRRSLLARGHQARPAQHRQLLGEARGLHVHLLQNSPTECSRSLSSSNTLIRTGWLKVLKNSALIWCNGVVISAPGSQVIDGRHGSPGSPGPSTFVIAEVCNYCNSQFGLGSARPARPAGPTSPSLSEPRPTRLMTEGRHRQRDSRESHASGPRDAAGCPAEAPQAPHEPGCTTAHRSAQLDEHGAGAEMGGHRSHCGHPRALGRGPGHLRADQSRRSPGIPHRTACHRRPGRSHRRCWRTRHPQATYTQLLAAPRAGPGWGRRLPRVLGEPASAARVTQLWMDDMNSLGAS